MGAMRYYEDFAVGDVEESRSRQLDGADIRMFGACSGLSSRIHTDALYCEKLEELGRPVVPYSLLLNVVDAFFAQSVSPDGVPTSSGSGPFVGGTSGKRRPWYCGG